MSLMIEHELSANTLHKGDRVQVRHGTGQVAASIQRVLPGGKNVKVRKWRKSKNVWSSIITIPVTDVLERVLNP